MEQAITNAKVRWEELERAAMDFLEPNTVEDQNESQDLAA